MDTVHRHFDALPHRAQSRLTDKLLKHCSPSWLLVAPDAVAGSQHPFLSRCVLVSVFVMPNPIKPTRSRTMQADAEQNALGLILQVPLSSTSWSMVANRVSGRYSRSPSVRDHPPDLNSSAFQGVHTIRRQDCPILCPSALLTAAARWTSLEVLVLHCNMLSDQETLPHQSLTVTLENLQELDVKKDRPDRLLRILPHLCLPSTLEATALLMDRV